MHAANPDEMLVAPLGRFVIGSFYVHWVYSPTLIGTVYFGRPTDEEFPSLEPMFHLPAHAALSAPYDVLVDCSELESLPPSAFEFLGRYLAVATSSASRMRRVSIVRPPGHAGIVLAGVFYELVRGVFEAALFTDRHEAARWLAHPDVAIATRELDEILRSTRATSLELQRLTAYLERNLTAPRLDDAASAQGLSGRSLQRLLTAADTSFRAQVERARVRAAEALLLDHEVKLEVVARCVGYSTLSHFTAAFLRATGENPSEFRRRRP